MSENDMGIVCGILNIWGRRTQATALFLAWRQQRHHDVMTAIASLPAPIRAELDTAFEVAHQQAAAYAS